jgi:CO/xanthine dehydrogenase Mo-binding subunit
MSDNPTQFRVIGSRPVRHDGVDKVTGRAVYGADIRMPGMLYGAVLRSPHAHARIVSVDASEALALPGVRAVITSDDLPDLESKVAELGEGIVNRRHQSYNNLARGKVFYYGHAVAAVAAGDVHTAQQALGLIRVIYEELPPVMTALEAMAPGAPLLVEDVFLNEFGKTADQPGNVAEHFQIKQGDLEEGFAQAAVVLERDYVTATVHQGYIEPHNATALWNLDGQITIWCSTQGSFMARDQVADLLEVPVGRIRVVPLEIGGGFGGKNPVYLEPIAALLSLKAGHRPVKLTMDRAEVLAGTGPTSGSYIHLKMGADREGRITAAQAKLIYEAGWHPGSPVGSGAEVMLGGYDIPNLQIDGYDVLVNKPPAAAYRAPGGTNAVFPAETMIDELAEALAIDPLEFRLRNAAREGTRRGDGPAFSRIGFLETLRAAQDSQHYQSPLDGPNRGRGVAAGYWGNYGGVSSAAASLNPDGSISLTVGSVDIGGSRTALAMQLAETLGISVDHVRPIVGDTDAVGYTEGTYGSRTTFATGWAVYELGRNLITEIRKRCAHLWDVEVETVQYEAGCLVSGTERITLEELGKHQWDGGGPVSASASVNAENWGAAFGVHIVDVEVDPETGKVDILSYTAAQDVGTAIHPDYVEGQIQGGVAQGVGWGLNEEYVYDTKGRLTNASLLDYRMPVTLDLPMIETILVEVPNPYHPYGVRGVGETPIVPPPAALGNAIYHAVGTRLTRLPMSPGRIMEALGKIPAQE